MRIKARDYQKECLAEIAKAVESDKRRALVVMAPALGKTITSAFAIKEFFMGRTFSRVLILCHSEEILRQTKKVYQKFFGEEFSYGMYVSNEKTARQTDFLFATFQTMKENRKDFSKDEFAFIVVDEAHHSKARTYFPTIRYFEPEFLLGLTATPDRLDGQKIEEIYGDPVYELGFVEATYRGLVAECDYELVLDDLSQEDVDQYLQSDEKLSITQLNKTIFAPKRDEEIVRLIKQYSSEQDDPKTMIFCKGIEHARKIAKLMGDGAAIVHNGQSASNNKKALNAFRDGKIRTIISVQMLNEGVDVPDANVIVFLRNTVSPTVFYQQLGRGIRLSSGKKKVKVLDFVNNCERIQTILKLKREIDDFRIQTPVEKPYIHGAGEADSREKFTLNIATPEFKAREVDIIDLLERAATDKRWTKEEVIAGLQKMYAEGKKVTCETVNAEPNLPSTKAILRLFDGQFNNALKAAGIPLNIERNSMSREGMLNEGKAMLERGEKITCSTIKANPNLASPATICKEFGTINNFKRACGVKTLREIMIDAGQEIIANGKNISKKTIRESPKSLCYESIITEFGSISKFIAACGGEPRKECSRESLIKDYWVESKKRKHWLNGHEIDRNENLTSRHIYRKIFGNQGSIPKLISEAQALYGPILSDEEQAEQEKEELRKKQEDLAKRYFEVCIEKGRWLNFEEIDACRQLNRRLCLQAFKGGLLEMGALAHGLFGDLPNGVLFWESTRSQVTDDEMLLIYWEESKKAGHWLTAKEIDECTRSYGHKAYYKRFGGIGELRQLAIEKYGDFTKETATN